MRDSEKDQLALGNAKDTAQGAMAVLDCIQNIDPRREQVRSLAAALKLVCEYAGLDPRFEIERAERLIHDGDRQYRPEFRAVADYAKYELGLL